MKKIIQQIRHDLHCGIVLRWKLLLPLVGAALTFCLILYFTCIEAAKAGRVQSSPATIEYFAFLLRGMRKFDPLIERRFEIPVMWLVVHLYLAFAVGSYAVEDMSGFGMQFLLRSERKMGWYLGKYVYGMALVLVYYAVLALTAVLFSAAVGQFSLELNQEILFSICEINPEAATPAHLMLHLFALPVLTSMAITSCQILLSMYIRPVFSFAAVVGYEVFSAYFVSYALIGNFSMIMRFPPVLMNGLNAAAAVGIDAGVLAAALIAGCVFLQRFDFLEKG